MKVIDKRKSEAVKFFCDIKVGEAFKIKGSETIYMKIYSINSTYEDYYHCDCVEEANAISLNTGMHKVFTRTQPVIPLKCSCLIEG